MEGALAEVCRLLRALRVLRSLCKHRLGEQAEGTSRGRLPAGPPLMPPALPARPPFPAAVVPRGRRAAAAAGAAGRGERAVLPDQGPAGRVLPRAVRTGSWGVGVAGVWVAGATAGARGASSRPGAAACLKREPLCTGLSHFGRYFESRDCGGGGHGTLHCSGLELPACSLAACSCMGHAQIRPLFPFSPSSQGLPPRTAGVQGAGRHGPALRAAAAEQPAHAEVGGRAGSNRPSGVHAGKPRWAGRRPLCHLTPLYPQLQRNDHGKTNHHTFVLCASAHPPAGRCCSC